MLMILVMLVSFVGCTSETATSDEPAKETKQVVKQDNKSCIGLSHF